MGTGGKLDTMANQIATFFRSGPPEEAVEAVADHIRAFWSPSMRRDLIARAETGVADLDPLVVAALPGLKGRHGARRTAATSSDPEASDAG